MGEAHILSGGSLVFPLLVQSRAAALVLCIFQTQANGPGWGVGGRKEARQRGRGHEYILFLTETELVVETWPVDRVRRRKKKSVGFSLLVSSDFSSSARSAIEVSERCCLSLFRAFQSDSSLARLKRDLFEHFRRRSLSSCC